MISIFLDTNILFSRSKDFTSVGFLQNLEEIVGAIEVNDLYNDVQIIIPRIVIDELKMQQQESYDECVAKTQGVKFTEQEISYPENYTEILNNLYDKTIKETVRSDAPVKVIIEDYPPAEALYSIIQRAVNKQAPFEGKGKESDKGFKDAIIWEGILAFKEYHYNDTVILISKDIRITAECLKNEYQDRFSEEIYFIQCEKASPINQLMPLLKTLVKSSSKIVTTYAQKLNTRLQSILCTEQIEWLYIGSLYEYHNIDYDIDSIELMNSEISHIEDCEDFSRYFVIADIRFECYNQDTSITVDKKCQLQVIYSFEKKIFSLECYQYPDGEVEHLPELIALEE